MLRRWRALSILATAGLTAACGGGRRGSPACGLALMAAPTVIWQRLSDNPAAVLREVPRGLPERLSARVAGFGQQGEVLVAYEGNKLVLGYQGPQFPTDTTYAFGLLVVDDTTQRVVGVLIYPNTTVPRDKPVLGVASGGGTTIGVYGVRVNWAEFSNPRCPLLGDSTSARPR